MAAMLYFANCRRCSTNCQICSSLSLPCGGIAVPGDPKRMIQNNCPSGTPLTVFAQAKLRGGGSYWLASAPLPSPLRPWQMAQNSWSALPRNRCSPARRFSGVAVSGLIRSKYSAGAFPVKRGCGHCPVTEVVCANAAVTTRPDNTASAAVTSLSSGMVSPIAVAKGIAKASIQYTEGSSRTFDLTQISATTPGVFSGRGQLGCETQAVKYPHEHRSHFCICVALSGT